MAPAFGQMDFFDVNYDTSVLCCQMLTQSGFIIPHDNHQTSSASLSLFYIMEFNVWNTHTYFLWQEMFHEKDYLNHRYHAKRFLYLCIIKRYLKLSSVAEKVEWSTFQNESRKPILVVHPGVLLCDSLSPLFLFFVVYGFWKIGLRGHFPVLHYHWKGNFSCDVAMRIAEAPIVLVRIIPTATSVFNVAKLNMKRNNIRALNQGIVCSPFWVQCCFGLCAA